MPGEKREPHALRSVEFFHANGQFTVITLDQIPGVGSKLMLDGVDNARRPMDAKRLLPPEQEPQQLVETGEMVHMPMRDEDVADAQKFARAKPPKIAKIEKQRAALENQIDVKAGIVEGVVDESGIEVARHNSSGLPVAAGPRVKPPTPGSASAALPTRPDWPRTRLRTPRRISRSVRPPSSPMR
jgi:hypothetical protein